MTDKPRVAIYARFSTDMQNENSTRDQIDACEVFAKAQAWNVVKVFQDAGVSGANRTRPDYQKMVQFIKDGEVDLVLAEGMSRLNRSQELSANLFAICDFHNVEIHTLADGRVEEIHIGMKGTMDALQIKRTARETHRGQSGKIKDGFSAGGLSFGYRVPIDPTTGLRRSGETEIDEAQALIVKRIFREFAAGNSPRAIAHQLNEEHIPAPRGGAWKVNTIYGNAGRGTGILNNQLYAGTRVWNRLNYRKDPETDKRVSRKRDEAELLTCDVPELRIIEPALWDAVKARQGTQRKTLKKSAPVALRRKKYLLSGLVQCGKCGGNMTVAGTGARRAYYCANAKEKGATVCTGLPGIRIDKLQPLVLAGLRDELMMPEAVARFSEEYRRHIAEANQSKHEETAVLRHAIAQQQKSINGCLRAVRDDRATESIYDMLAEAETTKKELEADLANLAQDAIVISPDLAELHRAAIDDLSEVLNDPDVVHRASEILGELIDSITIRHDTERGHTAQLDGKLMGLLSFADKRKAASYEGAACSLKLVAGVGFEPTTPSA
jgi:DNA invertase Pin-like site-specific DNA recombinase